jgi:biotin synthase
MTVRNDWAREEIQALYEQPFLDLVFKAQQTHRDHFINCNTFFSF